MAKIDLDQYKNAWQREQPFGGDRLSERELEAFMHASSRHVLAGFQRSLVFDLVFKSILLVSLEVLAFLMSYGLAWLVFCVVVTGLLLGGMGWQLRTLRLIPRPDPGSQSTLDLLREYIAFYYRSYYYALLVSALSSTFVFLIGSLYYLYFKYGKIPPVAWDDLLVLGVGLVLSFAISAVAQVRQGNFQIRQLEERVEEIEAQTISTGSLAQQRRERRRNLILIGIALVVGLFLLLCFLFQWTNLK